VPNKAHQVVIELTPAPAELKKTVRARKLVVISAGALNTPLILERSGVGKKDVLDKFGIPIVAEIDWVGENYQDHNLILFPYNSTADPDETMDGILSGRLPVTEAIGNLSNPSKPNLLGWNGIDTAAKIRPTPQELSHTPQSFQSLYAKDYSDPTRPLALLASVAAFLGDHSTLPAPGQFFTMGLYTAYPYSRGKIHITSTDVDVPAEFEPGYLKLKADVDILVWAYKKQREMVRRMKHFAGVVFETITQPHFDPDSAAAKWDACADDKEDEIVYTEEDDKAIEQCLRNNVQTTWHSCGTCAMRPKEDMGVVDKDLNVYGVEGLKIADLSILPENVGANTYSTALLVGEKAAAIIAAELGINF